MGEISVLCQCGDRISATEARIGECVRCHRCGFSSLVSWPEFSELDDSDLIEEMTAEEVPENSILPSHIEFVEVSADKSRLSPCRTCEKTISIGALKCPNCGEWLPTEIRYRRFQIAKGVVLVPFIFAFASIIFLIFVSLVANPVSEAERREDMKKADQLRSLRHINTEFDLGYSDEEMQRAVDRGYVPEY